MASKRFNPNLQEGYEAFISGDFPLAIEHFEGLIENPDSDLEDLKKLEIISHLGNAYLILDNFSKAIEYFTLHLKICDKSKNYRGKFIGRENLGNAHFSHGKYMESYAQFEANLHYARQCEEPDLIIRSLISLGSVCFAWSQPFEALNFFMESLQICKDSGDKVNLAFSLSRIGAIHLGEENYPESKNFLSWALNSYWEAKSFNQPEVLETCYDLVRVHLKLKEESEAQKIYFEGMGILKNFPHHPLSEDFSKLKDKLKLN